MKDEKRVESDIATGEECKEYNKWVQSNMPDARCQMPDARFQIEYRSQKPDRMWRMPDTRLDARCRFGRVVSDMETTEC